ncbi:MAG: hypothetical protein WHT06_02370 [Desulfobacterales bacterium]
MSGAGKIAALRRLAEETVEAEPARSGARSWWRKPLVAAAPADDRFKALPAMAAPDHLLPRDLLPTARSVVVFFIPFKKELVRGNRAGDRPSADWGLSYVQTNVLIEHLAERLAAWLAGQGFRCALTPATHNFDEERLVARWSHKHLGRLVNLGRFGTHRLLITPAGCAGRLGSLVTEAELGEQPLLLAAEACLLKAGKRCGKCIAACPVSALAAEGFDRRRCWERLKENRAVIPAFAGLPETTHVCGKCAAIMPCSFRNPLEKK